MGSMPLTSSYLLMLDVIIHAGISNSGSLGHIMKLLSELHFYSNQSKEFAERVYKFCWELLTDSDSILDEDLYGLILINSKRYLTGSVYSLEHAPNVITDCFDKLEKDITKISWFRLIAEETDHTSLYGEDQDKERITNILGENIPQSVYCQVF